MGPDFIPCTHAWEGCNHELTLKHSLRNSQVWRWSLHQQLSDTLPEGSHMRSRILEGAAASQQALHGQEKRELEKLLLVLKDECINFFGHTP